MKVKSGRHCVFEFLAVGSSFEVTLIVMSDMCRFEAKRTSLTPHDCRFKDLFGS